MELADVCILVRAGYVRGEPGIVGTLLIDRRIEMLSVGVLMRPKKLKAQHSISSMTPLAAQYS